MKSLKAFFRPCMAALLLNRYSLFLLLLIGYSTIMENFGGLPSALPAWRLELPLLVYTYYYLNSITRAARWQSLVTALPIFLFYVATDIFNFMFGRLPRFTEITEVPELFQVIPLHMQALIVFTLGLPLLALLMSIDARRYRALLVGVLPLAILLVPLKMFPETFMTAFEKSQQEIIFYSDIHSAINNGRLSMMLYSEARRQVFRTKISKYRGNSPYQQEFAKTAATVKSQPVKGNVHLIVLESFFDPQLFQDAHFSRNPVHPEFAKIFMDKAGLSISPVFGGGTAQAEFEVLCGVPAMRELSGVEFDVFTGAKTICLPNLLAQGGYQSIATNSFAPDFYNSINAYAGVGFMKSYYPQEFALSRDTYLSRGDVKDEIFMFDGNLFSQNLDFIARQIKENPGMPFFNYVITTYGHTPHGINIDKRPNVVEMLGEFRDEQMERAVNQYYYRTEAIAAYVKGLLQIDPDSLIILVSDHLPPFTFGPNTYSDLGYLGYLGSIEESMYLNRIYILENQRLVTYNTIRHFDVPRIILNYVTAGHYCQDHTCQFTSSASHETEDKASYWEQYMAVMAQAMNSGDPIDATSVAGILGTTESEEEMEDAGTICVNSGSAETL